MTHHDAPSGQPYSEPPMWERAGTLPPPTPPPFPSPVIAAEVVAYLEGYDCGTQRVSPYDSALALPEDVRQAHADGYVDAMLARGTS